MKENEDNEKNVEPFDMIKDDFNCLLMPLEALMRGRKGFNDYYKNNCSDCPANVPQNEKTSKMLDVESAAAEAKLAFLSAIPISSLSEESLQKAELIKKTLLN